MLVMGIFISPKAMALSGTLAGTAAAMAAGTRFQKPRRDIMEDELESWVLGAGPSQAAGWQTKEALANSRPLQKPRLLRSR
mmetsp:Transcript_52479/g.85018  ORF Transcript_52479/g.85018 Transcript_52479/m.85018 type:complete len:81 (-) Transcript_52479:109-351(-)